MWLGGHTRGWSHRTIRKKGKAVKRLQFEIASRFRGRRKRPPAGRVAAFVFRSLPQLGGGVISIGLWLRTGRRARLGRTAAALRHELVEFGLVFGMP